MRKLTILILVLLIQNIALSQIEKEQYPFKVEIKGEGKPIVLIPGLANTGEVWKQTVDSLKNNYQCHILTLAGFGTQKAIDLSKGFNPKIKVGISKYIENELSGKPILIGHSLGGFLALSIASSKPELVRKIIVVDSYPFLPSAYNSNINETNILPQAKQMKTNILTTADSIFIKQEKAKLHSMITDTINVKLATKWILESDRETIAQAMFEMMTTNLIDKVKNIKAPLLVLGSWYGLKDYGITEDMVKKSLENQYSKVKNHKIKIAKKAKHFIMLDEPNWTIKEINSFISANE